jgi:hypothetical protein
MRSVLSMSDPFAMFEDMSVRFPGGIAPRRHGAVEAPVVEAVDPSWDDNPKVMKLKGVDTEFFTVGALAQALGRRPVTVRSWEDKGWLPKSRFRTPAPKRATLEGKKSMGRRLYTRAQIEVVIEAAHKSGLLDPDRKTADWELFTKTIVDGWKSSK